MSTLFTLGLIGFIGFLCQWFSQKVKLPAILFLLLSGILLGPTLGLLDPNELFGDMLFPFISLSVAVILFEGALTLKRSELKTIGKPVQRMVSVGVLINGMVMAIATHYIIGLSWSLSALFGALMVVTGPTVIMPMLKTIRPIPKIADVLRWEGIVIDPIGALIAVLVYEWIAVQREVAEFSEIFTVFGGTIFVGLLIGLVAGYLFGLLLRHHLVPEKLHNFAALAVVCFVFAASDTLMHESGLLAVTVMGMLLANMKDVHIDSILEFKEDLTVVFVSALFIVLAARLEFAGFEAIGWSAISLLIVMQFIARPLKVALSFRGSDFSLKEKALISWIGPRGIVAAAVSAVFALRLEELGVDGAEKLVPLAFIIIIGTVVLQSLTGRSIARALGVAMPKTYGLVIVGANSFALAFAEALDKAGVETLICDTSWEQLSRARNLGLKTYYGNPSSDHAGMHLNLSPYGYMVGLANHYEYNVTQSNSFRDEFGARNVFLLPPNQSSDRFHKHIASKHNSGRFLFDETSSYTQLKKRIRDGWKVKATELSKEYDFKKWREGNAAAQILMTLKSNGDVEFHTTDHSTRIAFGDKFFYLAEPKEESHKERT